MCAAKNVMICYREEGWRREILMCAVINVMVNYR